MELIPASEFNFEQLTEAYNRTRIDYIVPMPMSVARLREYVTVYDVDLTASCVAMDEEEGLAGLLMMGIREQQGWITRLGVLPDKRRQGLGRILMDFALAQAQQRHLEAIWLEVIKDNSPAQTLFERYGFRETRELMVARRPPEPVPAKKEPIPVRRVTTLDHEEALILLAHRRERVNWLNETASMQNARNLTALLVELSDGSRGWVSYHASILQLTRIVVETMVGNPAAVAGAVLHVLHQRHATQDAVAENFAVADPKWAGFQEVGYFEAFRRIEMVKPMRNR
jgi:ribosomal protein S18 acetylase RimI-like enzyme